MVQIRRLPKPMSNTSKPKQAAQKKKRLASRCYSKEVALLEVPPLSGKGDVGTTTLPTREAPEEVKKHKATPPENWPAPDAEHGKKRPGCNSELPKDFARFTAKFAGSRKGATATNVSAESFGTNAKPIGSTQGNIGQRKPQQNRQKKKQGAKNCDAKKTRAKRNNQKLTSHLISKTVKGRSEGRKAQGERPMSNPGKASSQ